MPVWPVSGGPRAAGAAGSHSRTVPSSPPVASTGRPAACPQQPHCTVPVWPVSGGPRGAGAAGSHSRTVPSSPPVASTGRPATCPQQPQYTGPVWPVSGGPRAAARRRGPTAAPCRRRRRWPAPGGPPPAPSSPRTPGRCGRSAAGPGALRAAGSHSRTVPSSPPVASTGRPATCPQQPHRTGPVWPVSGGPRGAGCGGVPQPHRAVVAAGGQHRAACHLPPAAPRTGPAWPVSGGPDGASRRRLISAERSLSSVCLVKVRSEGVGQLHEPQDPASTATPRGPHPLQSRIRPLTGRIPGRGHQANLPSIATMRSFHLDNRSIDRRNDANTAAFT